MVTDKSDPLAFFLLTYEFFILFHPLERGKAREQLDGCRAVYNGQLATEIQTSFSPTALLVV